jgi:hypothetical protein
MAIALLAELPASQWLAYGFGAIGIALEWRAYWLHSGSGFRRWSAAGAVFWAAQYFLLGAKTAALTMACTAIRTLSSEGLASGRYRHFAALAFFALFILLTIISWQGYVSLLPAFAVLNTTLALFYLDNRGMRLALLASSLAWVVNDVLWQAWPALLAETVAVLINLRTIHQLYKNRQTLDGTG